MYTLHTATGYVTRDSDGMLVAPAQSADDPDFVAYTLWANAGGVPTIDDTPLPTDPVAIQLSKGEWMDRFTAAELETIYTMAKTVVSVEVWLERFKVSDYVNPADPKTIAGVQALEAAGILALGRASEILG